MTVNAKLASLSDEQVLRAIKKYGSANAAATALGIPKSTFKQRAQAIQKQFRTSSLGAPVPMEVPKRGTSYYIFTSAQCDTEIDHNFWRNLLAYASYLGAEVIVSGYTYNKSLYTNHETNTAQFHPALDQYICNERYEIKDKLIYCGEMNTLPTASDPLSALETYTRDKWGIFPHPRVCLKSVPTMFKAEPKLIMTTGSVTLPNYIQKKAGIKAEFHHVIGAVIVEIDSDGDFFCRHLIADKDGSFYDLTTFVQDEAISEGHAVEAITWGDIHTEMLDPEVAFGAWGIDAEFFIPVASTAVCLLDFLQPDYQFFHDLIDFRRRNHHNIDDPHFMYEMHVKGKERVSGEFEDAGLFLAATARDFCRSVVVDSNHDRALQKWLKRTDYRKDPVNAEFFLAAQAKVYESIRKGKDLHLVEWAIKYFSETPLDDVIFLSYTDSFRICNDRGRGIECGLHGDLGANGAKGDVKSFARMGPKANTADKHGAAIYEGIYQAGHSCKRDMGYNRGGLTSWNHSHIVTYRNGKRTILTMRGSKYCAK